MNIEEYTLEDLIADPTFVNYCLHQNPTDVAYWTTIIQANPHKSQLIQNAKEQIMLLSHQLSDHELAEERTRTFDHLFEHEVQISKLKKSTLPIRWLAAACLLIIGSATYFFKKNQQNNVSTSTAMVTQVVPAQKFMTITLSDGTTVRLAPASTFIYPQEFTGNTRVVELNGDAYFEVSHNPEKPFTVHTADLDVQVLGTSFNVNAFKEDPYTKVALFEGKVQVSTNTGRQDLRPGQLFTYNKKENKNAVNKFDPVAERDQMKGLITFDHASYDELRLKLSRKYGIVTKADPSVKLQFTGTIFNESLADVLDKLSFTTAYHFHLQSDSLLTVTSK
ncbi:FecR family protein [Sphingobacterium spiritivorum]|uniref:FecR family protein n=1 Tax=Sphingobacterium spiritivorum TaxID=258 RepID=UPI003DA22E09